MPLNKPGLIAALTSIFKDVSPNTTPEQKAQRMASAIEAYVKSGTVKTNVNVPGVKKGPETAVGTGIGSVS